MQTVLELPAASPAPAAVVPPKLMSPMPVAIEHQASVAGPAQIMLFGRDANGRPHGASLTGDTAAIEHAADLMDLYCIPAGTVPLRNLAATLPAGRLFQASGKAFVPFCKAGLYDQLLAATGLADAPRPLKAASKAAEAGGGAGGGQGRGTGGAGAGDPPATRVGAKAPSDHSQIGLGSIVLAQDEESFGYFPAKVTTTKTPDSFTLCWVGFELPEFTKPRRELALLHPEMAEAAE